MVKIRHEIDYDKLMEYIAKETKWAMAKEETTKEENDFGSWLNELEEAPQPTCNIDNPEDCEACGS